MLDIKKYRVFIPFASHYKVIAKKKKRGTVPSVTVAISLYNYEQYIIECLESVKSQTISNLDLVIVDDCSIDSSLQLARNWLFKYGDRFNKYMLVHHKSNRGLSSTRNTAFTMARTKYVFVLDADDLLYPRCSHTRYSDHKVQQQCLSR